MWAWIVQNPSSERRVAVAESGGGIIGFAAAGPAKEQGAPPGVELYMVYVSKSHHGAGVGQALLDAALGDQPAFLWVAKDNPRAQAFYRRNGFKVDGAERADETVPAFISIRMVRQAGRPACNLIARHRVPERPRDKITAPVGRSAGARQATNRRLSVWELVG